MRCNRRLGYLFLFGACIGSAPASSSEDRPGDKSDPQPVITVRPLESPPESIANAIKGLKEGNEATRRKAASTLTALADAEPYVRHTYSVPGSTNATIEDVLGAFETARRKRNADRSAGWAKEGRYDLLVDVCLHSDTDQLKAVGQAFFGFFERVNALPEEVRGKGFAPNLGFTIKSLDGQRDVRLFHERAGVVKTDYTSPALVRARSCEATGRVRFNWLVLTRDHLKGTNRPGDQWENCCIFHNSDLELNDLMTSLVVCDGDVNFGGDLQTRSLVIAHGTIRKNGRASWNGSTFYAGGDIVASSYLKHDNLFYAGGSIIDVKTGKPRTGVEREKPGLKENPFGVRFFQTADVGVELAVEYGVVTVTKLTPGSPLTKYGVQVGDVITQVNDKPALTVNDARRELRYSVVLEAGILHIKRGQEKLTRVVYFKNGLEK